MGASFFISLTKYFLGGQIKKMRHGRLVACLGGVEINACCWLGKLKEKCLLQELRVECTFILKWILRWDGKADFAKGHTAGCSEE
jgi:hypothetical protein